MDQKSLQVQCFVKKDFQPIFTGNNIPHLLYVSEQGKDASQHPRVMHAHEHHVEVVLIVNGCSEYLIGRKKRTIRAGDLLIYNSGVVHDEISGPDTEVETYCIAVGGLHMPGLRENALIPDDMGYIFRTGEDFTEMWNLCKMMFTRLSEGGNRAEAVCHSLMQAFLTMTLAIVDEQMGKKEVQEDYSDLGKRTMEFIDRHFREPIGLQDIGNALHVSPYYMSHVFKDMSGYSPMQYLLKRRIGEAQTMLIHTDRSIGEISQELGFETQSYFNLQFLRHVGMPPKKYRKTYIVGEQKNIKTESEKKGKGENPAKKSRSEKQ